MPATGNSDPAAVGLSFVHTDAPTERGGYSCRIALFCAQERPDPAFTDFGEAGRVGGYSGVDFLDALFS